MSEKLLYEIEMAFLKQIYEHKGAIGVNELLHIFQSDPDHINLVLED